MSRFLASLVLISLLIASPPAAAEKLTALARVRPQGSALVDAGEQVQLRLELSQPVPYRIFTLSAPDRLIIDFYEVDWSGFPANSFNGSSAVGALRVGVVRPGWSRMVLDLLRPLRVVSASLKTDDPQSARLDIGLRPASAGAFAASAGAPDGALVQPKPVSRPPPHPRQTGDRPLVVVLDPGHGGIDPGAQRDGINEADLILGFARQLREILLRSGNFKVILTRDDDRFVPLESRVSIAREAGADVFLSLHADALAEGRASGATVYTLSEKASDVASQKLAERHDRGDLLAGVDLSGQDDVIATVLMDMARTETMPRTEKLAQALVAGLRARVGVYKRPHLQAGFSVLKAPDIPSALIELGFLSSPRDMKRLRDPQWRQRAAEGIRDALVAWAKQDAEDARLLRK